MAEISPDQIEILGRLALEYQQKQNELNTIIQNAEPSQALRQLAFRAELTTDQFRNAQRVLLGLLGAPDDKEKEKAKQAAVALCRCFDEMRILFQAVVTLPFKTKE